MLNLLFALIGIPVSVVINSLADALPQRQRPQAPRCPRCGHRYPPSQWYGWSRRRWRCPACALPTRRRVLLVEAGTAALLAILPSFVDAPLDLVVNAFYTAVFVLVIVIDLEHRLILDVVTYPVTLLALLLSLLVSDNTLPLALLGAAVGLGSFFLVYWGAQLLYGPGSAALGQGDVKLAMAMGAMLGFHRVLFALVLAILMGGLLSLLLILTRRVTVRSTLPYGQYLAGAGIVMLIWGTQIADWYANGG